MTAPRRPRGRPRRNEALLVDVPAGAIAVPGDPARRAELVAALADLLVGEVLRRQSATSSMGKSPTGYAHTDAKPTETLESDDSDPEAAA